MQTSRTSSKIRAAMQSKPRCCLAEDSSRLVLQRYSQNLARYCTWWQCDSTDTSVKQNQKLALFSGSVCNRFCHGKQTERSLASLTNPFSALTRRDARLARRRTSPFITSDSGSFWTFQWDLNPLQPTAHVPLNTMLYALKPTLTDFSQSRMCRAPIFR